MSISFTICSAFILTAIYVSVIVFCIFTTSRDVNRLKNEVKEIGGITGALIHAASIIAERQKDIVSADYKIALTLKSAGVFTAELYEALIKKDEFEKAKDVALILSLIDEALEQYASQKQ